MTRASTPARPIPAGTWTVDAAHSAVGFTVRHLVVATVRGRFTDFDGSLDTDVTGALRAAGSVRIASIDTGHAVRDEHLRGPRYFDAARHPEIRFASTAIEPLDGATVRIVGDLTIKHTTRAIDLLARRSAAPEGRLELDMDGALRRSEFGIDSAELLDAGISDNVTLTRVDEDHGARRRRHQRLQRQQQRSGDAEDAGGRQRRQRAIA